MLGDFQFGVLACVPKNDLIPRLVCGWRKKLQTIYWEEIVHSTSLSSSPTQEPGDEAITEAALFSAIFYFCYPESMDCTQTIKFKFKNVTVNETWSHPFLTCVACRLLCLEHCFKQAKHNGRFRMQPRGTKLPPPPYLICSLFVFTIAPPQKQLKFVQR